MKRNRTSSPQQLSPGKKGNGSKRRPWSIEEDEAIRKLIERGENTQWSAIAEQLKSAYGIGWRTGKQCRERWHNHLDPEVSKLPWSLEEELILFESQNALGNKWADISAFIPGRSDNSIKNRFYSTLKKQFRRVNGFEATREDLKTHECELCFGILAFLHKKDRKRKSGSFSQAKDLFFSDASLPVLDPPDLPKLFPVEISDLFVTGLQLPIPFCEVSDESGSEAQFDSTDDLLLASEVFIYAVPATN